MDTRRRPLAIALSVLLALVAPASSDTGVRFGGASKSSVAASTGGGGGSASVLFDSYSQNIHSTYDPLCNPATLGSTGVIWCDGMEDGKIEAVGDTLGAATDGWSVGNPDGPPRNCSTGSCNDPFGGNFTLCNSAPSNTSRADFGAAGTPCTGSLGWNRVIAMQHCLRAFGGNPIACATNHNDAQTGVQKLRVRYMVRFAGASSTRCPSGFPNCPAFNFVDGTEGGNTNGTKGTEMGDGLDLAGISYLNFATQNEPRGDFEFGGLDHVANPSNSNVGKTCEETSGGYCRQHLNTPALSIYDSALREHWLVVEWFIDQTNTDNGSGLFLWYDDCGLDGKSCPATLTPRIAATGWDIFIGSPFSLDLSFSLPDSLWFNFWTPGGVLGEIQIDEIVVADGAVRTQPIGPPALFVPGP